MEHSFAEFLLRARHFHLLLCGLEAVTRSGRLSTLSQVRTSRHGEASACPSQDMWEQGFESNSLSLHSPAHNHEPGCLLEERGQGRRCLSGKLKERRVGGWGGQPEAEKTESLWELGV